MATSTSGWSRERLVVLAVIAGLVAALVPPPGAAAAQGGPTGAAAVPTLEWEACPFQGVPFECATARVPLDYDRPHGRPAWIRTIRLPASNPAARKGSIFLNPGGPGGSGVDFVRFAGPFLFSPRVRARFDLVGFDPRGVARSTPLRCFRSFEEAIAALPPFPFPVTTRQENRWVRADEVLADACARRAGPILDHMSTANVARDMDLLRRAVGDSRLTYAGYSYGSFLGATYANLFPRKVRALVVDAVLDPVEWVTGDRPRDRRLPVSTRLRSDQGAYATLQEFFRLCERFPDNCAFSYGDPQRRYDRLARRLRREPVELPDGSGGTFKVTYNDLVAFTLGAMYAPESWPFLAEALRDLYRHAANRDAAGSLRELRLRLQPPDEAYPNFVEGFPGVACSETDNPDTVRAWRRAADASDRAHPYFGRLWTWISSICRPWPGHDADRYTGPFSRTTSNPVLIVGNHFDPATRYEGAVTLDRLLPRSRLLTLRGWGHTSLFQSACIDAHVNRYLLTRQAPPSGSACRPDVVPFAQPLAELEAQATDAARARARSITIPPIIQRVIGD